MRRTIPLALACLLLPAPALAAHDGDAVDDQAESALCGQPDFALLVATLDGAAGSCDAAYDYHNTALAPEADCATLCSARLFEAPLSARGHSTPAVALPPEGVEPVGPLDIPFLDPDTLVVEGYHGPGDQYCVRFTSVDFDDTVGLVPPACVGLSGLRDQVQPTGPVPVMPLDGLGYTPRVEEGQHGTIPAETTDHARLEVTVTMRWNPTLLHERLRVGDLAVVEPVDPLVPEDVAWYLEHPDETGLQVSWRLVDLDGDEVDSGSRTLGHLGQVLAAAYAR